MIRTAPLLWFCSYLEYSPPPSGRVHEEHLWREEIKKKYKTSLLNSNHVSYHLSTALSRHTGEQYRATHTHTHTLSLSHTHTHTHTHSLSLTHTHTHTHTHTQHLASNLLLIQFWPTETLTQLQAATPPHTHTHTHTLIELFLPHILERHQSAEVDFVELFQQEDNWVCPQTVWRVEKHNSSVFFLIKL